MFTPPPPTKLIANYNTYTVYRDSTLDYECNYNF